MSNTKIKKLAVYDTFLFILLKKSQLGVKTVIVLAREKEKYDEFISFF